MPEFKREIGYLLSPVIYQPEKEIFQTRNPVQISAIPYELDRSHVLNVYRLDLPGTSELFIVMFVHFHNGVPIGAWFGGINADFVMLGATEDIAEEWAVVFGMRWQQHLLGRFNDAINSWANMLKRGEEYAPRDVASRFNYDQWVIQQTELANTKTPPTAFASFIDGLNLDGD